MTTNERTNFSFQPFGFQSGLYDPDTGLVHFGARWYDSATGRWLSKDPILLAGGLNLYVFCSNNGVNLVDPWGEATLTIYGNSRTDNEITIAINKLVLGRDYNPGHVWYEINIEGEVTNRGNYPKDKQGYQSDMERNWTADFSITFIIPDSKAKCVKNEILKDTGFNPIFNNCVDALERVLNSANIKYPYFDWPSDPFQVEAWVRGLNATPGGYKK